MVPGLYDGGPGEVTSGVRTGADRRRRSAPNRLR